MGDTKLIPMLGSLFLGVALAFGGMTLLGRQAPATIQILPPVPTTLPLPTATPAPITVYINGAVRNPGVYEISADSRVEQLLEMAGGTSAEAWQDGINLAASLFDGAQVFIPDQPVVGDSAEAALIQSSAPASASNTANALININTATREQLEQIPGIGPATADKILVYREDNGNFPTIEEIMNVSGIGEGKFDEMRASITIDP